MIHGNNHLTIAASPATPADVSMAKKLAAELAIPLAGSGATGYSYLLICSGDGLQLQQTGEKSPGPVQVSFTDPTMEYRFRHGGGRGQALARAAGLKKGWQPYVIDATGGLGRDGFILAHLGCRVLILERSPILAAMLRDGLRQASMDSNTVDAAGRIEIIRADSKDHLQRIDKDEQPDIIYLDPMFPERTKSSLVKKEMRILRDFAGEDPDAGELLSIALGCARNRVVVKRPRLAPELGGRIPSHVITGKTSRFDVYMA